MNGKFVSFFFYQNMTCRVFFLAISIFYVVILINNNIIFVCGSALRSSQQKNFQPCRDDLTKIVEIETVVIEPKTLFWEAHQNSFFPSRNILKINVQTTLMHKKLCRML